MDVQSQIAHSPVASGAPRQDDPSAADRPPDATVKVVAAWINQFARTIKTSRLYHATNPTVVRFREELRAALTRLLEEVGPVTYRFSADDILYEGVSLYPAKSRDDNLALPFHRDGVRALTFNPGVEARELDALVDALMLATGQVHIDDDLVTMLWQANLQHVDIDYVPAEGDVGGSPGASEEGSDLVPWPTASVEEGEEGAPEGGDTESADEATAPGTGSRSDDWTTGELTVEIEAGFEEIDSLASQETGRFRDEFAAEHEVSLMTTALAISRAYLDAGATDGDRGELAKFVPRMLRLAVGNGSWLEAREALALLRECDSDEWSAEGYSQELFQPISVTATVEQLDRQEPQQVAEFIALAKELGEPAAEWLNLVLSESQNRRTQKPLAVAISDLCRNNPERVAPWLADSRWHVVRNAVQVLGAIGGDAVVGLLRTAMRHRDSRVRREVVTALSRVEPATAHPLLVEMLQGADTRLFCAILHELSSKRDTPIARRLIGYLQDPAFEARPEEEKRAIYTALGAIGTDDVLPELEAELAKGNWLARGVDVYRQAIARCIARIGTARARALLERGAASKRSAIREVCGEALRSVLARD